jgi:hypothetical protein
MKEKARSDRAIVRSHAIDKAVYLEKNKKKASRYKDHQPDSTSTGRNSTGELSVSSILW